MQTEAPTVKASELRIGNWVNFSGEPYQIVNSISEKEIDGVVMDWVCEPIPLTPEVLGKAGFMLNEGQWIKQSGRKTIAVSIEQGEDFLLLYSWDIGINLSVIDFIETVHQLQNLFFALTGEELEINL